MICLERAVLDQNNSGTVSKAKLEKRLRIAVAVRIYVIPQTRRHHLELN